MTGPHDPARLGSESPAAKKDTSTPGQAAEFLVWTAIIQQSRGMLHVFLPLLDRSLDGVVHSLTDGDYIPIQVKSRGEMVNGMVQVVVRGDSLVDDRAVIIAGLLTDDGLGPTLLVVDEGNFKRLAARNVSNGIEVFTASFGMHPTAVTHWRPYLVPREGLAARLLGGEPPALGPVSDVDESLKPQDRHNQWLGFLGESEVVRRLAENSQLDLFRPFPDLEMVEVLARNNVNGRFAGMQVKTGIPAYEGEAQLHVRKATFVAAASTCVVGLAWLPGLGRFAEQCLLIPTEHLREVAENQGDRYVLLFHPESPVRTPLDPFRQRLSELGVLIWRTTENATR